MDGQRFDSLVRRLATRRSVVRGGAGALLGAALAGLRHQQAHAGGCQDDSYCGNPALPYCDTSQDTCVAPLTLGEDCVNHPTWCESGTICCGDKGGATCSAGNCCVDGSVNTVCPDLADICVGGYCQPNCIDVPDACTSSDQCCGDALCVGGACLHPDGAGCIYGSDCISGACVDADDTSLPCAAADVEGAPVACVCLSTCLGLGETCSDNADCCDGNCNAGTCQNDPGEFCLRDIDCTSGLCVNSEDPTMACEAITTGTAQASCYCAVPEGATSTITVHYRCCPEGATDVFAECHGNPLSGVAVALTNGQSCVTDDSGNCSMDVYNDTAVTISSDVTSPLVGVYCAFSDAVGSDTFINDGTFVQVPEPNLEVICDVYHTGMCNGDDGKKHDDGGKKDDGGDTELPDTGAGVAAAGLGGLIAGAAVFAGTAAVIGKTIKPQSEAEA